MTSADDDKPIAEPDSRAPRPAAGAGPTLASAGPTLTSTGVLFRHRLAVILGAFGVAALAAFAGAKLAHVALFTSLSAMFGYERVMLWSAPALLIAFTLRVL